jgi:hypothetical protein
MYLRLFFQKLFLFLCYLKFSCQQLQYGTLLHDLGTYEGQLLNSFTRQGKILSGIMHGEGTFKFHNGDKYVGSFLNDEFNGKFNIFKYY